MKNNWDWNPDLLVLIENQWDGKTIETENNTCDWKTIEIEIKSEIEKQLRGFDMLTEFNADDKQCWAKTVLIENHVDGKTMEMIIHWEWKL